MTDQAQNKVNEQVDKVLENINFDERSTKIAVTGLAAVGAYYVGRKALCSLTCLAKQMCQPGNLKARYSEGWALVTNAQNGLGKEYAYRLAEQGFDVVLMVNDQAAGDNV